MFISKVLFVISVFLLVIISVAQGYTYITQISKHSDYPNKCYDADTKRAYALGESFKYNGKCEEATCRGDFRFNVRGCGSVDVSKLNCTEYQQDYGLPYPLCCQKYRCIGKNGITNI